MWPNLCRFDWIAMGGTLVEGMRVTSTGYFHHSKEGLLESWRENYPKADHWIESITGCPGIASCVYTVVRLLLTIELCPISGGTVKFCLIFFSILL